MQFEAAREVNFMENDESPFREPEFDEINVGGPPNWVFHVLGAILLITALVWLIALIWGEN